MFTLEEIDTHIAAIKQQMLDHANQSYSISPSDGGTGRSVSRNDYNELVTRLNRFERMRASLTGKCGIRACGATFG